ncbi:glycerol dehydrogenase [Cryobacterium algoritolerans]|uniref:Glycerol dehydrogenase n=2 Tax=Cryobacterium algoritolerans TaxID=1259184 RepID=A0A4R8WVD7_9MICO|nr:glycerol dehydrogenase [Cryobacterium algoritolerans]TFC18133.1 glycerol dehydrogenase [Cryobacterium algoritolerans]
MTTPIRTVMSPGRYVQGKGAIERLGEFVAQIGSSPLIVSDDVVWGFAGEQVTASFAAADLRVERVAFGKFATAAVVDALVEKILETKADVIVGVGGGSTVDAAKAAGYLAGIRWVSVPTVASTDAPTSALAVIYNEEGEFVEYRFFPRNPDLVLIDTQIVANAPVEFLIAGVGDALATWLEARATAAANATTMAGGLPTQTGTALAKLSWDVIWENALPALDAVRDNLVTPALEKLVEANTLLSGLGFESGGLAAAHAIHNGLTAAPQTHGLTHGQKVNIGSMAQLVLEGAPRAEIEDFIEFTTLVGLPTTLTEIGLTLDDEKELQAIGKAATLPGETIHNMPFVVTADDVVDALKSIERLSRSVRKARGLPAPVKYVQKHAPVLVGAH